MKKVALLLGSLLMVGAVAQAADAATTFKPTGNVDLQYRYYGRTENSGNSTNAWNPGNNNYSRIQLMGQTTLAENQSMDFRVRDYNSLAQEDRQGTFSKDTATRLRYYYDHGTLGDSKVDFTSRVKYEKDGDQSMQYMARFDFHQYMPSMVSKFVLAPKYSYEWGSKNSSDYSNNLGLNLETYTNLPYGIGFEFNVKTVQSFYGKHQAYDKDKQSKSHNLTTDIKAVAEKTVNVYTQNNLTINFNMEGGLDTYDLSQHRQYGASKTCYGKYQLYVLPTFEADYMLNNATKLYAAVGAEYKNWSQKSDKSASDWRWQPTAWAGFKTTF
ncbi:hypothetical protein SAMN02745174_00646 [Cetobacterium ceti]|uniref:Porin n=1 Tax=Cetobacterium ceti TaxID=180163 RepID=A0A1T4KXV0_9FUSO|nr:hypothetical protein [Cetobacterium ceti]SJZ47137.1 hypothetical protein SAMN02745174_00646 [Cetobacterium ceti]